MRREWRGRSSLMQMQLRRQDRSMPLDCRKDERREMWCARARVCVCLSVCLTHLQSGDGVAELLQTQSEHSIRTVCVTHYKRDREDHPALTHPTQQVRVS